MRSTSLVLVSALCGALAATPQTDTGDDIQVLKNLLKYDFRALPSMDDGDVAATVTLQPELEDFTLMTMIPEEETVNMKAPSAVTEDINFLQIPTVKLIETFSITNSDEEVVDLKFTNLQKELDAIAENLVNLEAALNKRIDDVTAQINNNVMKQLNDFQVIYDDKLNALRDTTAEQKSSETSTDESSSFKYFSTNLMESSTVESREAETVSGTSEWSMRLPGAYDEQGYTTESIVSTVNTDMVEATTAESTEAESVSSEQEAGGDGEWEAVRVVSEMPRDSSWRAAFCLEQAGGAASPPRAWGPGDLPDTDVYDDRLLASSGCRRRLVPPYDRQSFHWYLPDRSAEYDDWSQHWRRSLSREAPEQLLALRTVGEGRADIKIYWNGEKKYYFAFSNSSNTLEFIRMSPWKRLWMAKLQAPAQGEHYLPLHFTLDQEELRWRAGCGGQGSEPLGARVPTGAADTITLEIETSAFPAKMLYDCPLEP